MRKEKLKPCPFCGRKKHKVEPMASFGMVNERPIIDLWCIDCKCGVSMIQDNEEKVIKMWNKRTGKICSWFNSCHLVKESKALD